MYKRQNISKMEQQIIVILSDYDITFKEGYSILVRKNQE